MKAAIEMMLMRAMAASAAKTETKKRKKADGRKLVCVVCGRSERSSTYAGTAGERRRNDIKKAD